MDVIVEVVGFNGDTVRIAGDDAGSEGIYLDSELDGFFDVKVEASVKPFAARPGQKFLGARKTERRVVFRVQVLNTDDPTDSWRQRDARWRRLWSFTEYSVIRVITDESSRELKCRLEEIEVDLETDPHVNETTQVVMTVVADDPFWYAPDYVVEQTIPAGREGTFKVQGANPTGNMIYPVWVFPQGKYSIMEGSRAVDLPEVVAGNTLMVDTDPGARQLQDTQNTNIWAKMNGVRFVEGVAPFTGDTELKVRNRGSQSAVVQLRLRRPFDRPWGWA